MSACGRRDANDTYHAPLETAGTHTYTWVYTLLNVRRPEHELGPAGQRVLGGSKGHGLGGGGGGGGEGSGGRWRGGARRRRPAAALGGGGRLGGRGLGGGRLG